MQCGTFTARLTEGQISFSPLNLSSGNFLMFPPDSFGKALSIKDFKKSCIKRIKKELDILSS